VGWHETQVEDSMAAVVMYEGGAGPVNADGVAHGVGHLHSARMVAVHVHIAV
jgi:hypothetical protein